jgi:hypothetical protein
LVAFEILLRAIGFGARAGTDRIRSHPAAKPKVRTALWCSAIPIVILTVLHESL